MKKKIWYQAVKSRRASLFRAFCIPYGSSKKMKSLLGENLKSYPVIVKNMKADVYFDKKEMAEFGNIILSKIKKDSKFGHKHFLEFEKRFKQLISVSQEIKKIRLDKLNNSELKNIFSNFTEKLLNLIPFMITPHLFQVVLEKKVKKILRSRKIEEKEYINLAIPCQQTFETQQQKELLRIALKISNNFLLKNTLINQSVKKTTKNLINISSKAYAIFSKYEAKWAWLTMEDYVFDAYDQRKIITMLKTLLKDKIKPKERLNNLIRNQRNISRRASNLIKKKNFTKEELNFIQLLQKYIWLRTGRLEAFRKAFYFTKQLMLEIAKRANLSQKQIFSLSPFEIIHFLKKQNLPNKRTINSRVSGYVIALIDGKINLYSGKKWPPIFENKFGLKIVKKQKIIKGQPACAGEAKGKAIVVTNIKDISRVKKGNILITTMTNPDFVIAMGKVAAIVTDEGGITCHAAIVSREFGIPCVIGTRIATSVFKNGDLLKVDANNGVVKKID